MCPIWKWNTFGLNQVKRCRCLLQIWSDETMETRNILIQYLLSESIYGNKMLNWDAQQSSSPAFKRYAEVSLNLYWTNKQNEKKRNIPEYNTSMWAVHCAQWNGLLVNELERNMTFGPATSNTHFYLYWAFFLHQESTIYIYTIYVCIW